MTTRAEEHLFLHLQRFSLCLDAYQIRFPADEDEAAEIPEEQIDAALARTAEEVRALERHLAATYNDPTLPLEQLRLRFGLAPAELLLVVAAAGPAIDISLSRRINQLTGKQQPDAGFLVQVLARDLAEERVYLAATRPTASLLRWRLLKLGTARGWSPETPALFRPVLVPERVIDWMRGDVAFDPERFERTALLRAADAAVASAPQRESMARALFRTHGERRLPLVVLGPALSGKATAVMAAAATQKLPVLDVDLESVTEAAQPAELLADLGREAMLRDAVLLLRHGETIVDKEKRGDLRRAVLSVLGGGALWTAVTLRESDLQEHDALRRLPGAQLVRVTLPTSDEQLVMWRQALPPSVPLAPEVDLENIVQRYHLTPGDILEAGIQAAAEAQLRGDGGAVTLDDVVEAVRGRLRHRLGDVAELMTTTLTWDDVVLPENIVARIVELLAAIRFQSTVMGTWGFARKVAYGRAVSALFSGPPGTGKTMVATLIAKELGLELFRVDLSRVVSKWVGETEKNLGRAFDEAKNSQAVLLFDEADALFAKRTDVKSSNDRYANLEVNYLLQRLEAFEGIVLLTTNNQSSIDDAFRRRLRFRVEFPAPDENDREQLWRAMLPSDAPLGPDVDFGELARRYEMSGGYIKNAVVRAAYLAAGESRTQITGDLLLRAAQLEWEEMGRLAKS